MTPPGPDRRGAYVAGAVAGAAGRGVGDAADGVRARRGRPVTEALATPAGQACAFLLGCAVIHAARAQADRLTAVLAAAAILAAVLVLLVASLDYAPGLDGTLDGGPARADP